MVLGAGLISLVAGLPVSLLHIKQPKINTTMKTQSIKTAMYVTLLATLLLSACSNKENTAQNTGSSKSDIEAPELDIHTAVISDNMEAVKQHIAAGSDLNVRDPFGGSSPLISAAVFGKTEMAKVLVDAGVDLNFQNNDGSTALHTAAFFCRPEIVQLLLEKNADKTIKNKYGATAYENVAGSFTDIKAAYDMMGKVLGPMGLTLDYAYIEKTRPEIAEMLK